MFIHPIVVLDFETTGLNAEEDDRVTEVAAIRIVNGKIIHRFQSLVNCQRRISRSISSYTHITQNMIDCAPLSGEVFRALSPFIGNDPVFAHNAEFDQRFFRAECERADVTYRADNFVCTLSLAQHLYPGMPSYALPPLAHRLGLQVSKDVHRAGPDAELCAQLLSKMVSELCVRYSRPFLHVSMLQELLTAGISAAA